jgi:hypothetical protein
VPTSLRSPNAISSSGGAAPGTACGKIGSLT